MSFDLMRGYWQAMSEAGGVRTCSDSLTNPGACCVCREPATVAALTADMVEHARCERHGVGSHFLATKPLVWSTEWGPA